MRFEIPSRYRHFRDVVVRYARWDLGRVDLVDPHTEPFWLRSIHSIARPTPMATAALVQPDELDADEPPAGEQTESGNAAAAQRILDEYSASGMPPAYLPKNSNSQKGDTS